MHERTTVVFAKAGLDNVTSAMYKHQHRYGLDVQFSALVLNFNIPVCRQAGVFQSAADVGGRNNATPAASPAR